MSVARNLRFQIVAAPFSRCIAAEELLPHVVVNSDDLKPVRAEEANSLGTNQASRTGDNADVHKTFQINVKAYELLL